MTDRHVDFLLIETDSNRTQICHDQIGVEFSRERFFRQRPPATNDVKSDFVSNWEDPLSSCCSFGKTYYKRGQQMGSTLRYNAVIGLTMAALLFYGCSKTPGSKTGAGGGTDETPLQIPDGVKIRVTKVDYSGDGSIEISALHEHENRSANYFIPIGGDPGLRSMFLAGLNDEILIATDGKKIIAAQQLSGNRRFAGKLNYEWTSGEPELTFKSEDEYQGFIGNPYFASSAPGGDSSSAPLNRKKLASMIGRMISISNLPIWTFNSREWERGGSLYLFNDDGLGLEFRITCAVDSRTGDTIMKNPRRRLVDVSGLIKNFSREEGLVLDPCNLDWDEVVDGPRKGGE